MQRKKNNQIVTTHSTPELDDFTILGLDFMKVSENPKRQNKSAELKVITKSTCTVHK
jgi:hypothetical protein